MNSFGIRASRRAHQRAVGSLMLVLPLVGCALQLSPAQAQPEVAPKPASSLSPEQKAAVEKLLGIGQQEEICKSRLDLKVDDATLADLIKSIKEALPGQKVVVNVRDANPVRLSFDLKQTQVGDMLQSAEALSGCQLWVLDDGLLIARPVDLLGGEQGDMKRGRGGEWAKSTQAGGSGWSNSGIANQVFATAIAQEVKNGNFKTEAPGEVKTLFGNFSPDGQRMLQQIVAWTRGSTRTINPSVREFILSPNTPVTVSSSDSEGIVINLSGDSSDSSTRMMGLSFRYRTMPISQSQSPAGYREYIPAPWLKAKSD